MMNLLNTLIVLNNKRRLIIGQFIVMAVLSVTVSLFVPKWYLPRAIIMPPTDSMSGLGLMSMFSGMAMQNLSLPGMQNSSSAFLAIMKSRTIHEEIINEFELIDRYKSKNLDWALKTFNKRFEVGILEEGTIEIEFLDKDPELAASLVNAMIQKVDDKYTDLSVMQARQARIFVEKRLNQNITDLTTAEESLKAFQEAHKAISVPDQVKAQIEAYATLRSQIVALEITRSITESNKYAQHAELKALDLQLDALKRKIRELEGNTKTENVNSDFMIPLLKVPGVGLEFARLMREVKVQETIFEFLTKQYEQEKLKEAKDTPSLQVLDFARPPLKKAKPKRAIIVILACILSTALTVVYMLLQDAFVRLRISDPDSYEKVAAIMRSFKKI